MSYQQWLSVHCRFCSVCKNNELHWLSEFYHICMSRQKYSWGYMLVIIYNISSNWTWHDICRLLTWYSGGLSNLSSDFGIGLGIVLVNLILLLLVCVLLYTSSKKSSFYEVFYAIKTCCQHACMHAWPNKQAKPDAWKMHYTLKQLSIPYNIDYD